MPRIHVGKPCVVITVRIGVSRHTSPSTRKAVATLAGRQNLDFLMRRSKPASDGEALTSARPIAGRLPNAARSLVGVP